MTPPNTAVVLVFRVGAVLHFVGTSTRTMQHQVGASCVRVGVQTRTDPHSARIGPLVACGSGGWIKKLEPGGAAGSCLDYRVGSAARTPRCMGALGPCSEATEG